MIVVVFESSLMNSETVVLDAKEYLVGVKEKFEQEKINSDILSDSLGSASQKIKKLEFDIKCLVSTNDVIETVISKLRESEKKMVYISFISLSYLSRTINAWLKL